MQKQAKTEVNLSERVGKSKRKQRQKQADERQRQRQAKKNANATEHTGNIERIQGKIKRARGEKQANTKAKASGRKAKASKNKGKSKTTHSPPRPNQAKQASDVRMLHQTGCTMHVELFSCMLHAASFTEHSPVCPKHVDVLHKQCVIGFYTRARGYM